MECAARVLEFQFSSPYPGSLLADEASTRNQGDNKFTWVIKDYCTWRSDQVCSDQFVIGGYKWCLQAGFRWDSCYNVNFLYLCLRDADYNESAAVVFDYSCGFSVQCTFTVVNQLSQEHSQVKALTHWFDQMNGFLVISMIPLTKLHAKDGGFLVNNEVKIVVVINVLDESNGSVVTNKPLKRLTYLVNVNGFQVPPSQVDLARRIFELHPETALNYCTTTHDMRRFHKDVLLSLIRMLFKVPQEPFDYSMMSDIEGALVYMKNVGFKLDWLEKKFDEVKENKKRCDRVTELEQQLQDLMKKFTDVRKQLKKERAEIEKIVHDLSFIDVV